MKTSVIILIFVISTLPLFPQPKNTVVNNLKIETEFSPNKKHTLYFEKSLDKDQKEYLDKVAKFLKDNPKSTLKATGHNDNSKTYLENQNLAKQRVNIVVKYLVSKKINRNRITAISEGAKIPAAPNTSTGKSKNNRVEIEIITK